MENVTIDMLYSKMQKIDERLMHLEHLLIPEEKLSKEEIKELDELMADVKKGNVTPFSKIKK